MEFSTNYKRLKHSEPEMNDGPVLVETAGYLSIEQLINMMTIEGRDLVAARKEMYDFAEEKDIDVGQSVDPTRGGNLDPAEASQMILDLEVRAEQARIELEAEKAAKAAEDAAKAEEEPPKQA